MELILSIALGIILAVFILTNIRKIIGFTVLFAYFALLGGIAIFAWNNPVWIFFGGVIGFIIAIIFLGIYRWSEIPEESRKLFSLSISTAIVGALAILCAFYVYNIDIDIGAKIYFGILMVFPFLYAFFKIVKKWVSLGVKTEIPKIANTED